MGEKKEVEGVMSQELSDFVDHLRDLFDAALIDDQKRGAWLRVNVWVEAVDILDDAWAQWQRENP